MRGAKRDFYHTSFEENKNNSKGIWKFIKSLTCSDKVQNNINKLKIGDSIIEDKAQIADKFNTNFFTIADKLRSTLQQLSFDRSKLVDFVLSKKNQKVSYCIPSITSDQVLNILNKISLRKAAGVDGINARVLCVAAPVIAPTIAKLINCSFATGIYPQRWKSVKVIPLYKSCNVDGLFNYRPISVLRILSKLIERHIHDTLYIYLCANDLI